MELIECAFQGMLMALILLLVSLIGLYFMSWGFRFLFLASAALLTAVLGFGVWEPKSMGLSYAIVMAPFVLFGAGLFFAVMRRLMDPDSYRNFRNGILKFIAKWGAIYLAVTTPIKLLLAIPFGYEKADLFMFWEGKAIFLVIMLFWLIHRQRIKRRLGIGSESNAEQAAEQS